MRSTVLVVLALLISLPASSEWQTFGDVPRFRSSNVSTDYQTIKYPDIFTSKRFFASAGRAKVMSRVYPSTETHDFREGGGQFCEPSTNWERRLKWNNGSCIDADGQEYRFIERYSRWGDVVYFKCGIAGVTVRSLITERHPYAIGNPEYGETVSTRVVVNGREVGSYAGYLPNVFITGDLRQIPTDQGISVLEKLKKGSEGKFKLETSQVGRTQLWDFKFSLRGFKRAINWCTEILDDSATEAFDASLLAEVDPRGTETLAISRH